MKNLRNNGKCVFLLLVIFLGCNAFGQTAKPTVFIKDGSAAWAHVVHDRCPDLAVSLRSESAKYIIELAIEPDPGLKADWVIYDSNGLLLSSGHTARWENSAKDACE